MNEINTTTTALNAAVAPSYIVAHHEGGQMFAGDTTYYQRGWYVYGYEGCPAIRVEVCHPVLEDMAGDIVQPWELPIGGVAYHECGPIFVGDDTDYPAGFYLFVDDQAVPVTVYYPGSNDPVDGANILY